MTWTMRNKGGERLASLRSIPPNLADIFDVAKAATPGLRLNGKVNGPDAATLRWDSGTTIEELKGHLELAEAHLEEMKRLEKEELERAQQEEANAQEAKAQLEETKRLQLENEILERALQELNKEKAHELIQQVRQKLVRIILARLVEEEHALRQAPDMQLGAGPCDHLPPEGSFGQVAEQRVQEIEWLRNTLAQRVPDTFDIRRRMVSTRWTKHVTERINERLAGPRAFFGAFLPGRPRRIFRTEGIAIIPNRGVNKGVLRLGRDGKPINLQDAATGPKPRVDRKTTLSSKEVRARSKGWLKALDESLVRSGGVKQASGLVQDVRNAILCNRVTVFKERRTILISSSGIFIFSEDCSTLITAKELVKVTSTKLSKQADSPAREALRQTFESHFISAIKAAYADDLTIDDPKNPSTSHGDPPA